MSASSETRPGLIGSLRRLLDTGLGLAQNRLELFAVELQEEKLRFAELLLLICAFMTVGTVALTLVTLTVVLVFWENGRMPALMTLSAVYAGGGIWLGCMVRGRLHAPAKPFPATLGELEKDRKWARGN